MSILYKNRFDRTRRLFGDVALARLRGAHVTVAGLGAVGSYAVEALARAGIGNLRVIDFDRICPSNINRQLYALDSTMGEEKTNVCVARVQDINPECNIEAVRLFITEKSINRVLNPRPDILIDAIDSLNSKVALIVNAVEAGIRVFSSMGAARRTDPRKIHIADISKTRHCPLAKFVRKRLRRRGIEKGLTCVFSDEELPPAPADLPEDTLTTGTEQSAGAGRERFPMGSISVITGIFGLMLANEAIKLIITPGEGE